MPWMKGLAPCSAFFAISLVGVLGRLERVEVKVPHSAFAGVGVDGHSFLFGFWLQ